MPTQPQPTLADAVARGFADTYGSSCTGIWSAPGRVNLIGEHTDYNEGFVLPFAIGARTAVAAARRTDGLLALASAQFPSRVTTVPLTEVGPGAVQGWTSYPTGVAWALREAHPRLGGTATQAGVSLYLDSTVPTGSGLSSSAALECAAAARGKK